MYLNKYNILFLTINKMYRNGILKELMPLLYDPSF